MSNPALDIYSPAFDPREALVCAQLSVPYPEVAALNNLAECRRLLPPDAPDAMPEDVLAKALMAQGARAAPGAQAEAAPAQPPRARGRAGREAQDRFAQGPLALLKSLIRRRVCVVTRHRNCARGTCTGMLVAADRHLNLLLVDAEDVFVPADQAALHLSQQGEGEDGKARVALAARPGSQIQQQLHPSPPQPTRRRFGQVLLRGEGIVLIYAAP
jgi:small nuclear ribonucleoprotein (snRNP)-like protein